MSSRISTRTVVIVGAARGAAPGRRRELLRQQCARTGWRRSPPTRASARSEKAHDLDDSPLADYGTKGVDNERLSGGLAGVAGVARDLR